MPLTTSIIPFKAACGIAVIYPASPSIDFSIRALQGQTVIQCPQDTQLDSPIVLPPSHKTRGWSSSQRIESVSFTSKVWHACTQRPHRIHWSGSRGWYCRLRKAWVDKVFVDVRLAAISLCYEQCSCRCCCRKPYNREGGSPGYGRMLLSGLILTSSTS